MINELYQDSNVVGKYVRVTGHASQINVDSCTIKLEHDDYLLYVDTSEVPASSIQLQSLVQFIGEIRSAKEHNHLRDYVGPDDFYMKARVVRIVDGLDLELYRQTIDARREYLKRAQLSK